MRKLLIGLFALLVGVTAQAAEVGAPAPDFALKDLDGNTVKLADQKGKIVVLEWFNPECPFVKASHTKGSLVGTAKKATARGVVWLAVNSGLPGKQGAGADKNREAKKAFSLEHPILLDESGTVGHAYGATNTPHLFVIDKTGKLVYRGAIDNSPDGEGASPTGGKLVNYVETAIDDAAAGRPVKTADTRPYGCSVKYGEVKLLAITVFAALTANPTPARVERPEWIAVVDGNSVSLVTRAGFHVNADYPIRFTLTGGTRIDRDKFKLEPCPAPSRDACAARADLPPRAEGVLAFSVCDPERCIIEKIPLASAAR